MDAFKKQQQSSSIPITVRYTALPNHPHLLTLFKSVFLVGGFAASEWLFSNLRRHFEALNVSICRPDSHVYVPLKRC